MQQEVTLVRNAQRALGLQKQAAESAPVMGRSITTPSVFVREQWDVWGSGRGIIDAHTRLVWLLDVLHKKASQNSNFALSASIGTAKLLSTFVAQYAGVQEFDAWVQSTGNNETPGQASVHEVLQEYYQRCSQESYIELGSAAHALQEAAVFPCVTVEEPLFAPPAVQELLESVSTATNTEPEIPASEFSYELRECLQPRFVALCGSSVSIKAVKEEIEHVWSSREGRPSHTVVFCDRPLKYFDTLSPCLSQGYSGSGGVHISCSDNVTLYKTPFGQALHAAYCLTKPELDWVLYASEFAYNPLSGLSSKVAEDLNYAWRTQQCYINKHAISFLSENSIVFKHLYSFARQLDSAPLDYLEEQLLAAKNWCVENNLFNHATSQESEAAFNYVLDLTKAACSLGNPKLIFEILPSVAVQVSKACTSVQSERDGSAETFVEFQPFSKIDDYAPSSIDAVILADVSKSAFSVPSAKPATVNILDAIGIRCEENSVQQLRTKFCSLLQAPKHCISFIMPLRDYAGNQQYPSFVFDEFVNNITVEDAKPVPADKEKVFKVPAQYFSQIITLDEHAIVEGAGQTFAPAIEEDTCEPVVRGTFTVDSIRNHLLNAIKSEVIPDLPRLSPSQIETYLQCPYYWFVDRKIGIKKFDTSIDAALIGSCVHEVFKQTFDELAARGHARITSKNLEEAQCIAENVFDSMVEENPENIDELYARQALSNTDRAPDDIRLYAATDEGAHVIAATRKRIRKNLEYMTHLPEAFEFYASEFKLPAEQGITYAGAVVSGSIDRIDINASSNTFAILDYKGSIYKHEAGVSKKKDAPIEVTLPHKVQALMYAQMLLRLGKDESGEDFSRYTCAGALYLSYKARTMDSYAAGSFDACAYDAQAFTSDKKSMVQMNFTDYLNEIERLIEPFITQLAQGVIEPNPQEGACKYCSVTFCAKRRAE